jgi:hypothetical protein
MPLATDTSGIEVSTGVYDQTDLLRIPDVDPNFYYMNKGHLFFKLLQLVAGRETVDQPRHEFFNDDKFKTVVTLSTDYTTETTIIINEANAVAPRTVLYNQTTDEALYVTAVSGATLTVVRAHQGTTQQNLTAATDKLIVLQTSLPEGADAGEGIAKLPTKDWTAVGFYSETLKGTDLQEATNMLNSAGQISGQMADYTNKLLEQMDNDIRWSARDIDTTTESGTLFYTNGFNNRVTTNATLSGTLNWQDFNDEFNDIYDLTESSPSKFLLCGPTLFEKINTIAWTHHTSGNAVPEFQSVLGAYMTSIQLSQGGVVKLIRDPYGFSAEKGVAHKGFLVDPAYINLLQFKDWNMVWRDVSKKEGHIKQTEVFGSLGLKIAREEPHATVSWTA